MPIEFEITFDNRAQFAFDIIAQQLEAIANSNRATEKQLALIAKALLAASAKSIRLALPTVTRKGVVMANFELANDEVATIGILVDDASGAPVAAPAGDVFTVVSSNPASLGAAMGTTAAGGPAIVLTPLVQVSPGLQVTVTDSAGLTAFTQLIDIVQDTTPKAITLDITNAVEVAQPVPTATGP